MRTEKQQQSTDDLQKVNLPKKLTTVSYCLIVTWPAGLKFYALCLCFLYFGFCASVFGIVMFLFGVWDLCFCFLLLTVSTVLDTCLLLFRSHCQLPIHSSNSKYKTHDTPFSIQEQLRIETQHNICETGQNIYVNYTSMSSNRAILTLNSRN